MAITTLARFQNVFMRLGKIIKISQLSAPVILALRKAHVGLVDQAASGTETEFDMIQDVVNPLGAQVRGVNVVLAALPGHCQAAIDKYLKTFICVELGISPQAINSEIEAALQTQMNNVGAHVLTGGVFKAYFTVMGISLPVNASPSIPDTYITDTVIADAA